MIAETRPTGGPDSGPSGGRTWWAHFEFTRINTTATFLSKKFEDLRCCAPIVSLDEHSPIPCDREDRLGSRAGSSSPCAIVPGSLPLSCLRARGRGRGEKQIDLPLRTDGPRAGRPCRRPPRERDDRVLPSNGRR